MSNEIIFFTLGSIFVYALHSAMRLGHLVSALILHAFLIFLLIKESGSKDLVDLSTFRPPEIAIWLGSVFFEHIIVRRKMSILFRIFEKVGVLICIGGFVLSVFAFFDLTRSDLSKGAKFIKTGIYAYLRHPFYLGLILFALGGSIYLSGYISAVLIVIFVSTRVRERILEQEKGLCNFEGYAEYKKKVPSGFYI